MSILDFNLIGEEVSRSCGDVTILRHQSFFPVKTGERRELFDVRDDTFWRWRLTLNICEGISVNERVMCLLSFVNIKCVSIDRRHLLTFESCKTLEIINTIIQGTSSEDHTVFIFLDKSQVKGDNNFKRKIRNYWYILLVNSNQEMERLTFSWVKDIVLIYFRFIKTWICDNTNE